MRWSQNSKNNHFVILNLPCQP